MASYTEEEIRKAAGPYFMAESVITRLRNNREAHVHDWADTDTITVKELRRKCPGIGCDMTCRSKCLSGTWSRCSKTSASTGTRNTPGEPSGKTRTEYTGTGARRQNGLASGYSGNIPTLPLSVRCTR